MQLESVCLCVNVEEEIGVLQHRQISVTFYSEPMP